MKNLTKRTKMLLAIAGVVILVIAAGIALVQPGGMGLFGTSASVALKINADPAGSETIIGGVVRLSVANGDPTCRWSSNSAVVSADTGPAATTDVRGVSLGTATITASCNTGTGRKGVSVVQSGSDSGGGRH